MKLRHAVALALVGWYLMLAPRTSDNLPITYDTSASLNKWKIVGSYDTAIECNEGKKASPMTIIKAEDAMSEEGKKLWNLSILNLLDSSVCISTDDPRLAK